MNGETATGLDGRKSLALKRIRETGGVIVALSGGVDSAVLLALALESLGSERVLAVTGRSASLAAGDLADAEQVARLLGARHRVVDTREQARPAYRANAGDRCYHCRTELFSVLAELARDTGFSAVAYGAITDDFGDFRPGMDAAREYRVQAPLLEAGLSKADVRVLAREAGLTVRDKPAGACLASRIPTGIEVTPERLQRVGEAESRLRELGFSQFRVRYHGEVARIELDGPGIERCFSDASLRAAMTQAVREAGFRYVAVDLQGYRTGSLNPTGAELLYRIGPKRDGGQ